MAKAKKKKKQKNLSSTGRVFSESGMRRRQRDAAYREALGIDEGSELPKTIGNTTSAGGSRDSRRNMGGTKDSKGATRSRIRLIG